MALVGEITIPSDKSLSHRAIILGALTKSKIEIKNLSLGEDCLRTLEIFKQLGAKVTFLNNSKRDLILDCQDGFKEGDFTFDCGNSGTTTRLLMGLFAGSSFNSKLVGDESLSKRPMKRVIEPLVQMGARIKSNDNKLPVEIKGAKLKAITYHSPIASAQVKSCLLLAGLLIDEPTRVYEKTLSRNHTELLLEYLEAAITTGHDDKGFFAEVKKSKLVPKLIEVAGDISSAAFFMVAAAIVEGSEVLIKNVGLNPTRTGIIDIFKQCGINFEILNKRVVSGEIAGDILVKYTKNIKPFEIKGEIIPRLIDEIPILAILALFIKGKSTVKDAQDLRNKESDRISTIVEALRQTGAEVEEYNDGFSVIGCDKINKNLDLKTHLDHRLAMSYYVLSLVNKGKTKIEDLSCINTSFPEFLGFIKDLENGSKN